MHEHHHLAHASDAWTLAGALVLGLISGAAHCSAMCGGIVLAAARVRAGGASQWSHALLFQAGRVFTYAVAATALSLVGAGLTSWTPGLAQRVWAAILGLCVMAAAVELVWPGRTGITRPAGRVGATLGRCLRRLVSVGLPGSFAAGASWGLIPCMLSWSSIVAAASLPPMQAALSIVLFGMGTAVVLTTIDRLGVHVRLGGTFGRRAVAVVLAAFSVRMFVVLVFAHSPTAP